MRPRQAPSTQVLVPALFQKTKHSHSRIYWFCKMVCYYLGRPVIFSFEMFPTDNLLRDWYFVLCKVFTCLLSG